MRSLWPVVRGSCDPIRSAESLVHKVRDHALSSVFQVVAVVHPNASVVCNEGDVVALFGQNVQRVDHHGLAVAGTPLRANTTT
jgi:hypothetical protein